MRTIMGRLTDLELKSRLAAMVAVPTAVLLVVGLGGLAFLDTTTGRIYGGLALVGMGVSGLIGWRLADSIVDALDALTVSAERLADSQRALLNDQSEPIEIWRPLESADTLVASLSAALGAIKSGSKALWSSAGAVGEPVNPRDEDGPVSEYSDADGADNTVELPDLSPLTPLGALTDRKPAPSVDDDLAEMLHQDWHAEIKRGVSAAVTDLAHRHQSLIGRQLEIIDGMELSEQSPDRLSALFAVDHLAGRMRRTTESLLVLAGAEPARRDGEPVPVGDMAQLAVGEIEDYRRVDIGRFDAGFLTPDDAWALAHLSAELLENAAAYSPPETRVEVHGRLVDAGRYVVEITDRGVGLTPGELDRANEILSDPPDLSPALGSSLGLVVVGRLARRLDASVRLESDPSHPAFPSGTLAVVSIPATRLVQGPEGPGANGALPTPPPVDEPPPRAARPKPSRYKPVPAPPARPVREVAEPADRPPEPTWHSNNAPVAASVDFPESDEPWVPPMPPPPRLTGPKQAASTDPSPRGARRGGDVLDDTATADIANPRPVVSGGQPPMPSISTRLSPIPPAPGHHIDSAEGSAVRRSERLGAYTRGRRQEPPTATQPVATSTRSVLPAMFPPLPPSGDDEGDRAS